MPWSPTSTTSAPGRAVSSGEWVAHTTCAASPRQPVDVAEQFQARGEGQGGLGLVHDIQAGAQELVAERREEALAVTALVRREALPAEGVQGGLGTQEEALAGGPGGEHAAAAGRRVEADVLSQHRLGAWARVPPLVRAAPRVQAETLGERLDQGRLAGAVLPDDERHRGGEPQTAVEKRADARDRPGPLPRVVRTPMGVHTFDDHGTSLRGGPAGSPPAHLVPTVRSTVSTRVRAVSTTSRTLTCSRSLCATAMSPGPYCRAGIPAPV